MVEDCIQRCLTALVHCKQVRGRLTPSQQYAVEKANMLTNINVYGAYLKGARAMYRALERHGLLSKDITDKSMLKAYMQDSRGLEWLLEGLPEGINLRTDYVRNKKGKIVSANSYFVKYETKITKI